MFSLIKQHRLVSVLILMNIIAVVVVIVVIVVNSMKTATVNIEVAPAEATIELNGTKYTNLKSHDVLPGNYHVRISMEGMQTKEYDFDLEKDGFVRVRTYLLDNAGTFDYYLTHPDDEMTLADVADDDASKEFIKKYNRMKSIKDQLPAVFDAYSDDFSEYTRYELSLDERDDCPKILCLLITDKTGGNKQIAIDKVAEMGYDPDDYKISYEYVPDQFVRVGDDTQDED